MSKFRTMAAKSITEIQEAETKLNALAQKKLWIERVRNNPETAANLYFGIFDNFLQDTTKNDEVLEKLSLLLYFKVNPLLVKNKDGLNPFEYFYEKNHEKCHILENTSKSISQDQKSKSFMHKAAILYDVFSDFGFDKEQLRPISKTLYLWAKYEFGLSGLKKSVDMLSEDVNQFVRGMKQSHVSEDKHAHSRIIEGILPLENLSVQLWGWGDDRDLVF